MVLVSGDPGIGKCVAGDTRVLDPASGAYAPITELAYGQRQVLAVDEATLLMKPAEVSAFHERGLRAVLLKSRRCLAGRCTARRIIPF